MMPSLPAGSVQEEINKAGLNWKARDSKITELAKNVRPGNLFGLSIGEPERIELMQKGIQESARFLAVAPPPKKVDWRSNNGNWVTRVKYQATCGSCVAFATCAVLESRALIGSGTAGTDIDLSEAHLFACGGGSCNNGWNFEPALQQARNGVGLEGDFTYQPKDVPCKQIPSKVQVTGWSRITTMSARKQAVADNGPVIAGMRVFSDFYSYGSGIYKYATGNLEGLHAVAIVGYNDPDGYWIIKNSWDTDWGDNGYVLMAYGECGIDSEFPFFDPTVTFTPPLIS
jgi:C1A family cysteine protease